MPGPRVAVLTPCARALQAGRREKNEENGDNVSLREPPLAGDPPGPEARDGSGTAVFPATPLAPGSVQPAARRHVRLRGLAQAFAVMGGALICALTLMTCVSVLGRNTTGWTLVGDLELTAAACGAAVSLFLPLCQMERRNITVDFFTAWVSSTWAERLERLGALLMGLSMLWLAWRSYQGALMAWETQAGSMLLGFPEWVIYCGIVPGTALAGWIGLYQAAAGFDTEETAL